MGDIADMMLNGTLCESCGVYLEDNAGEGFPQLCAGCAKARKQAGNKIRATGFGTWQDITPINTEKTNERKHHHHGSR